MFDAIKEKQEQVDVYTVDINTLSLHPLATTTPTMLDEQYQALKQDIEINGQIEPGTAYRNRLVDGRHRYLALNELGVKTMKIIKMPNNSTLEDIRDIVNSKEVGRHQTPTQLAIYAYNAYKDGIYKTIAEAGKAKGISVKQVSRAKRIAEGFKRPDILDTLFNGERIQTNPSSHITTNSLDTIVNWLSMDKASTMKDMTGIAMREAPTETEEALIAQVLSRMSQESEICRQALSSRLYSQLAKD